MGDEELKQFNPSNVSTWTPEGATRRGENG